MKHIKHNSERLRVEIQSESPSGLYLTSTDMSLSSMSKPKNLSLFNLDMKKQSADRNSLERQKPIEQAQDAPRRIRNVRLKPMQKQSLGESPDQNPDKTTIAELDEEIQIQRYFYKDRGPVRTASQLVQQELNKIEEKNNLILSKYIVVESPQPSPRQLRSSIAKSSQVFSIKRQMERSPLRKQTFKRIDAELSAKTYNVPNKFQTVSTSFKSPIITPKANSMQKLKYASEQVSRITQEDFYNVLKNYRDVDMRKELYGQRENIYIKLIDSAYENNQLPKAHPLIQRAEKQLETVNISRLGKSQVQSIANSFSTPQFSQVSKVDLSSNNLGVRMLTIFLQNAPQTLQHLNLCNSSIDGAQLQIIVDFLPNATLLKTLNLEDNRFYDLGCINLCKCLADKPNNLSVLNISKNKLSYVSCDSLGQLILKSTNLTELYLHYNSINQHGGVQIFKGLVKNKHLKVLDLSFNSLGNQGQYYQLTQKNVFEVLDNREIIQVSECIESIIKFFNKNLDLIHLDLSHNKFTEYETKEILQAFNKSTTIYGFHYEGNQHNYVVDREGFLTTTQELYKKPHERIANGKRYPALTLKDREDKSIQKVKRFKEAEGQKAIEQVHRHRRIDGINKVTENQFFRDSVSLDTCWICGGWQEIKISWIPKKSGRIADLPIYLHVSVHSYRPILMNKLTNEFFSIVIVPPDTLIKYFFSNPVQGIQTVAHDQLVMELDENDELRQHNVYVFNEDILIDSPPHKQVNYIFSGSDGKLITEDYVASAWVRPREEPSFFDFSPYFELQGRGWQVETSFFSGYRTDSETLLLACFHNDFENSKISRLVKDEVDQIKQILMDNYQYFFNSYKYYVSIGLYYHLPLITTQAMMELLGQTPIMDGKFRQTDLDLLMLSCGGKNQPFPQASEKGIVRHQFMEIFVRIALEKYQKTSKTATSSLLKLLENDGVIELLKDFEPAQEWRDNRYWREPIDKIITQSMPFLKYLFKYTAQFCQKRKTVKGEYIWPIEFKELFEQSGLINENLTDREVYQAYLSSMQTQVDELFSARHYQMNIQEFVEALSRIAERLSLLLPAKGQKIRELLSFTQNEKILQPLEQKVAALFLQLYLKFKDTVKESFKWVTDDDDYFKLDWCMMSIREYRKHQKEQASMRSTPSKNKRLTFSPMSTSNKRGSSFVTDDKFSSDEEEEKSLDMNIKEYILSEQTKEQKQVSTLRKMNSFKLKGKIAKVSQTFNMANILRFLKRQAAI